MYMPPHFRSTDAAVARELMSAHPFATLIAVGADGAPVINHLPLLLAPSTSGELIVGHMARRNPLAQAIAARPKVTAMFHGPHAYISPTWYQVYDVPTWNYAVVHAHGTARLIDDEAKLLEILKTATAVFEGDAPGAWAFGLPEDLAGEGVLARHIVGVEIAVAHVECKLKLSQNRSAVDRRGVLEGLAKRGDPESMALLAAMRRYADPS
jgi:transcriptional regulator